MDRDPFDQYGCGEASEHAHALYLKILDDFPALIWRAGTDAACDWFNATWLDFTGRTLAQEQGNGWTEGVHPDDLGRCVDFYLEHFRRRAPFRMEYRLRHHGGAYRWILDIGRPFYDLDGSFLGYIGSCYDVSENHRMVSELTEAGAFRDQLLAIVGHDLKNLIGCVPALARLLEEQLSPLGVPEPLAIVGDIRYNTEHTLALLSNLLDWASARQGAVRVNARGCDLHALAADVLALSALPARNKRLSFVLDVPPGLRACTDPDLLRGILRNLLGNAVKYSPEGGRVRLALAASGGTIRLEVQDQGPGLPQAVRDGLAGNGGRLSSQPGSANEPGTGLGLLICREFLALLGGSLRAETPGGGGTRLVAEFPESMQTAT